MVRLVFCLPLAFGWLCVILPSLLSAKQLVKAASAFPLSACFLGWKKCTYGVFTRTPAATLRRIVVCQLALVAHYLALVLVCLWASLPHLFTSLSVTSNRF